jgi:SAM-dependent methyltransferase
MKQSSLVIRSLTVLLFFSVASVICAQEKSQNAEFVPQVGQAGKDVIWVPTPGDLVNKMMEVAEVTDKDFVIDLGSGDGRTVITAAKLGAKAIGIEYNPEMVALSKKNAEAAGVSEKTQFLQTDLFEYDLSQATVITMFLLPEINLKLRPRLLDLKPGTRVVSNTFTMGEWEPDAEVSTEDNSTSWHTALMWIVPAKVEGIWKLGEDELNIRQEFQMFYGTFKHDTKESNISEGRITGDTINFKVDGAIYTGHLTGKDKILGTVTTNSAKSDWLATLKGTGN